MATFSEIITNVVIKGSLNTTASFYTDALIEREVNKAKIWAESYHKWPMTEYMDKSGSFTSGTEEYAYPNTAFKTDTIRMLKIGDYLFEKKRFEDYLKFRESNSSATDRIFSDYGRTLYINPNCASGTTYCFGQLSTSDYPAGTDKSAFSLGESEADEAITEKAISNLKAKAMKLDEAIAWENMAKTRLEEVWKRIQQEQYAYSPKDSSMFERLDVVESDYYEDDTNPLRW